MKTYPVPIIENKMHEPNCSGSQKSRGYGEKSPFQAHNLNWVLGDGPSPDIILVGLAGPLQEVDGIGVAQIPLKGLEHVSLHLEDLLLGVSIFSMVKKLSNRQCDSLLGLASNKEASDPQHLELGQGYNTNREEVVDNVDGEEKGLRHKMEV